MTEEVKVNVNDIYATFLTDSKLEAEGKWLDYGMVKVRIARSGGANKRFARLLEAKTKPYQRAIKTETIDPEIAERIMREVFAETVVTGWQTKIGEEWQNKVVTRTGEVLGYSAANVARVFQELPDLFADVQAQAQSVTNFREASREANAGNS